MDKIELSVASRDILGKKVRHLRRQGITPLHLFGHGIKSLPLQCDTSELERVLAQAGHTGLISLKVDHEKKSRTAVLREFHRDWQKGRLIHADFYQVKMTEKIRLEVPIILMGEAPALKASKENMLDHELETLTVECLPGNIPAHIEVDVSSLNERGQSIRIKDIAPGEGVTVLNDPELVVAKIAARHVEKEEEREEAVEEAAGAPEEAAPAKEQATED
jgi:large subunit ribosomal protein L25